MSENQKKLLILDDEESIRHSIAAFMEDDGYKVFQASSAETALDIIKNNKIDEAIVDIRLPGMDGNIFMVKAKNILPDIKFVVHTGSADYVPPEEVKKRGITSNKIFIKPAADLSVISQALKDQYI